jgi:hypothetical protein
VNPFEQLRLLTVSPHQAFEDIALAILRKTEGNSRLARVRALPIRNEQGTSLLEPAKRKQ